MDREYPPAEVPDFVPDDWIAVHGPGSRAERGRLLREEAAGLARESKRDVNLLASAVGICFVLFLVALGWAGVVRHAIGSVWFFISVAAIAVAFGVCLRRVHRIRRRHEPHD